jgi:hypothetical protein
VVGRREIVSKQAGTSQESGSRIWGNWRATGASAIDSGEDVLSITEVQEVSTSGEVDERLVPAELSAVADAAGERLRAETDEEPEAADRAAAALLNAATSAMGAGYSLSEIAQAETSGKERVRDALGGDALRRVQRTGRQAHDARTEHHRAIARAMRLGLSTREIAAAANVTHGTVRAIVNRLTVAAPGSDMERDQPAEDAGQPDEQAETTAVEDSFQ